MSHDDQPVWQPISALSMIAAMIAEMLINAQEHYATLKEAEDKPYVLDDVTVNRVIKANTDQLEDCDLFEEQLTRWKQRTLTADQARRIATAETQVKALRQVLTDILSLAGRLKEGTINRILEKDDAELGLEFLMGKWKLPDDSSG